MVTKLDRLGRSLEHPIELAKHLEQRGVDLVVLDQGIDTSTALGRLFFQIIGAIAEFEHALMSERTMDGLAAARARGRTGGQKPSSNRARSSWRARCSRKPTVTASGPTPWRRSLPSLALADPRSTATWPSPSTQEPISSGANPRVFPAVSGLAFEGLQAAR